MSASIDEADEATEWAVRKLKKARTKTAHSGPFPSVTLTKTGAWIKDQYDRMVNELEQAERAQSNLMEQARERRSGFGSHYDETSRRLNLKYADEFWTWHRRMSRLLDHVQVLAESLADDDEVTLSVAEVKKLSTSMEKPRE